MIYQNDQYYLQIEITQDDEPVTSNDCDEMIIKIGNTVKKKSTGDLTYSSEAECWLYPLSYEQTSNTKEFMQGVLIQAWFNTPNGQQYFDTNVETLNIGTSIINSSDLEDIIDD